MLALDATFPIDLLKGARAAVAKAEAIRAEGGLALIPAPALAEVLVGAHFAGGKVLEATRALVAELEVLPVGGEVADRAGRLGAELKRRGVAMSATDLLVAAACVENRLVLVTRDPAFARVPGLTVEAY